jgi:hypothetical protein
VKPLPTGFVASDLEAAISEAFDEALDPGAVKNIARPFRSAAGAGLGLF